MSTETTTTDLVTTCSCLDGEHHDPQAAKRAHRNEGDAQIIARHTGRHVIPLSALAAVGA
jgi:hypothetical protein